MAAETPKGASAVADGPVAFRTLEKLGPHLSMMMGRGGFHGLLTRALFLAAAEVPWLTTVQVVDGDLVGLKVAHSESDQADLCNGEVVLLAQLLGLLAAFIGPALTLRLLSQIWPQLPFDDPDFSATANEEKAE
ncbi:hypothetical protein ABEG18_21945 [Alsobacter sp. KACC 23698]|uniref:Uncharacterized protein n=1 Tax=Alsobacter sp. KACC 23698 TaxID=3149229 RepID=A0AAU7JD86_9HYPH